MSTCHVNASIVDQPFQQYRTRVFKSERGNRPVATTRGSDTLFVSKRVYRIQVSGSGRRIKGAQRPAKQANCRGSQRPPATEFKNESRSLVNKKSRQS